MEIIKNFFRATPSDFSLKAFSSVHLLILFVALLGLHLIVSKREELREGGLLKKLIVYGLLTQQVLLYGWYIFSGYFSLAESLPLYNCRLAILSIVIGELFKKEKLKYIGIYWGLMGSVLALLVPVVDPFGYDHISFYSFVIGHILLLWGSVYLLLVEERPINMDSLRYMMFFTNRYHLLVLGFNKIFQANYCYLIASPVRLAFIDRLPGYIYSVSVLIIFDLLVGLTHVVLSKLSETYNPDLELIEKIKFI